jgi:D-alanine transaminase
MPRFAYVNGRYLPHKDAHVHIEDRGYQFADGVYEVVTIYQGKMVDEGPHLDRLERSLSELRIDMPMSRRSLQWISRELLRRNDVTHGLLYMQITRGVAPRNHRFPKAAKPALVMTTRQTKPHGAKMLEDGVKVITLPDIRWGRCDIKSVSLLPNCLNLQKAEEAGAYEAWQYDREGKVTEGCASNAWIVLPDKRVVTRPASNAILNGITRQRLIAILEEEGYSLEERAFTLSEAQDAREAFVTSSSSFVLPVSAIDDKPIGNGKAGILTGKLRQALVDFMASLP